MKIDLTAKDSLEKNGLRIIREGLAVAKFGICLASGVVGGAVPGPDITKLAADDGHTAELNPEEFLVKPFRILSATVTPGRFFDFTKDGVLKAAVPLFQKLTVYANHNADVNQWKGYTAGPVWDAKNTPPGINANMVIDRTVDANLARGVEIGALRSASVTIWFEYEKSHPDLRYYYDHVGTEVDGELVRFVITKITRAAEVSVVWEGEDPFAKALSANLADETDFSETEPDQGGETMKVSEKFAKRVGMTAGEETTIEALEAAVETTVSGLENQIATLKPDADAGRKHLDDTRQRAATLYKTVKGDAFRQDYVDNVLLKADLATAQAMADEYADQVDGAAPLKCPKCGEKLTRRSSQAAGDGGRPADDRSIDDYKL